MEDMYFEADSKYYLSGLSHHSSSEGVEQMFAPIRHGKARGIILNDNNPWIDLEEQRIKSGVGFHPACFELFRIGSEIVFGKVNTDGEYSNSVFIPGFRVICEDALQTDEDFDVQQNAFPQREGRQYQSVFADPFLSLPSELVQNVVSHLAPQEIAAMRLASRAFEHLSTSLWHRLLLVEFPCIYEAWRKDVTPYICAFQNVNTLQNLRRELEEWGCERRGKARELSHDPKLKARFLATEPEMRPWHTEPNIKKLKKNHSGLKGIAESGEDMGNYFYICGSIGEIGVDEAQDAEENEDDDVYEA
ncbi:hypothetical protein V496_08972 [Pseudogymnoascus sp. VKM F-4515 (FW-2607)]|nr:hypothetical protein V496_08972 [Pseudogymnoascus sp. VKM F-4515 (FW-2607)]